mmetsp:Transcript_20166/g.37535  ORF Transcript_20166/g.37535 Transcript_20166/m.37535 type:complete len:649 (-) Transcript_20166:2-1948(-)
MEADLEKVDETFEASQESSRREWVRAFFSIFNASQIVSTQGKRSYLKLLQPLLFLLNMMSLIMPSASIIDGYYESYWFFSTFNYLRLDALAWNLGLQEIVGTMTVIFVALPAFILAALTYIQHSKTEVGKKLIESMHLIAFPTLRAFREVMTVPILCMLISMLKYGYGEGNGEEYVNVHHATLGLTYGIVATLTLPLFLAELYVSTLFLYQIDFNAYRDNYFSRPHNLVQLRSQLVVCGCCMLEFAHDFATPQLYLGFSSILFAYLSYLYLYYLPFYNDWANALYSTIFAYLTSASFATLLAFHFSSAEIIIATSIFMFPCYFVIVHSIIAKKVDDFSKSVKDCRTPYEAMTCIKKLLVELDNCDSSIREARSNMLQAALSDLRLHFEDSKLCSIWLSLFYCFKDNNPILAIQTLRANHSEVPLDCQFLEIHLGAYYDKLINSEELVYTEEIAKIKEDDRRLCMLLVQIYELLLASKNDPNSIESKIIPAYNLVNSTKTAYKRLTLLSNKRPEVLDLYRNFMYHVLNDFSGAQYNGFLPSEKGVSDDSKKVNFIEIKLDKTPPLADSYPGHEEFTGIASMSSGSSVMRLDKFRKLKDDTLHRVKRLKTILAIAFVFVLGIMIGLMVLINYFIADIVSINIINQACLSP